jgi:hypothetical protein
MENSGQIVSDKIIEIGGVVILIIAVLQTLSYAFKIKSDQKLLMRILEQKDASDQLIRFVNSINNEQKHQPIKWALTFAALSVAFIIIHYSKPLGIPQSENYFLFIISVLMSLSFLAYYLVLRFKLK